MNDQAEIVQFVITTLESLNVPYFITGSVASIRYGEYRATNDIDIVARLDESHVAGICSRFALPDFYVSEDAALDAVRNRFQFNILHPATGLKADIIVPALTEFEASAAQRSRRMKATAHFEAWFSSPEDVILNKLLFYQMGEAEKHLRDIAGVLRAGVVSVDRAYIENWAEKLRVLELWKVVEKREREAP